MKRNLHLQFVLGAILFFAGSPVLPAPAEPPAGEKKKADPTLLNVADYLDWEQVGNPQISPDGTQIIYTRQWVNTQADRWESALWIMKAAGSRNRFLVEGSDACWSGDGTRIAYLAEG